MEKMRTKPSRNVKIILALQVLVLAAGNYVGWSTILREVDAYCNQRGGGLWGLTDFSGGSITNPLLSACFWGSIAFVITFAWTLSLLFEKNTTKLRLNINRMWWLLLGGTIFALANNIPVLYKFYTQPVGSVASCSSNAVTNPYLTSCFLGFSAFLIAFILTTFIRRSSGTKK